MRFQITRRTRRRTVFGDGKNEGTRAACPLVACVFLSGAVGMAGIRPDDGALMVPDSAISSRSGPVDVAPGGHTVEGRRLIIARVGIQGAGQVAQAVCPRLDHAVHRAVVVVVDHPLVGQRAAVAGAMILGLVVDRSLISICVLGRTRHAPAHGHILVRLKDLYHHSGLFPILLHVDLPSLRPVPRTVREQTPRRVGRNSLFGCPCIGRTEVCCILQTAL